jgi:hypothetical protein
MKEKKTMVEEKKNKRGGEKGRRWKEKDEFLLKSKGMVG